MTVRQALRADLEPSAGVHAAAFAADPWFRWLFPDPDWWPTVAAEWFRLVLERAFEHGHTYVEGAGACSWIPPDVEFPKEPDVALAVELLSRHIGERTGAALGVIGGAGAAFTERPPRFHCVYVGVRPDAQRNGTGRALLARVLDRCDVEQLPASLTSTNDANLPFYRSLGFVEIGEVPIPDGPHFLRPMWRDPR